MRTTPVSKDRGHTIVTTGGSTGTQDLLPLCDVAGYSCFIAWAFAMGWFEGIVLPPGIALVFGDSSFFLLRLVYFAGAAVAACLLLLLRGAMPAARHAKLQEIGFLFCCFGCSVTLFLPLSIALTMVLWLLSGIGQSVYFFYWAHRLKVLSRPQQLHTVCGAFIVAGCALSLYPFIEPTVLVSTVTTLPIVSYVCLLFARRHFPGEGKMFKDEVPVQKGGIDKFRVQIPFKDDRRFIFMKGLHTALYSVFFGFLVCATLSPGLYPINEIVLGIANVAAALVMLIALRVAEKKTCNGLPRLFLPMTSLGLFLFCVLWPSYTVLVCATVLFVLYSSYEILSAYTTYAYSTYDSIRYTWELYSSKCGNTVGFSLGWAIATITLFVFKSDATALLTLCFFMVASIMVVYDSLFKEMKLVFGDTTVDSETRSGVFDLKSMSPLYPSKGKWNRACDGLVEKYRLSPRQKEIFFLLAKGRNVQYIKDDLVLSTPTVKSHIYSIYQKMDIHSHQELINMIEEAVRKE